MKKRILTLTLALLLCLGLAAPALAAGKTVTEAVPCRYDAVNYFSEGLAAVELDGKWGYIDKTGREVVPCKYDEIENFSEGLALAVFNTGETDDLGTPIAKCGFIDKSDKEVVPCKYGAAWRFSEGLAPVKLDGKYGFIDKTGKEVVPCKYDDVLEFSEGMAPVLLNGKWGFLSLTEAASPANTAFESTQRVSVDGKPVEFQMYALKGANGGVTNYVRLRDVAFALNGTAAQFNVDWNAGQGIVITTKSPYTTATGTEMNAPFSGDQEYEQTNGSVLIDGKPVELAAFTLQGGRHTYFKLRDLGKALGFNVGWSAEQGVFIETDKPYTDAD